MSKYIDIKCNVGFSYILREAQDKLAILLERGRRDRTVLQMKLVSMIAEVIAALGCIPNISVGSFLSKL